MDVKVALYDRFHTPTSNGAFRRNMHNHTPKRCSFIHVALKPADNTAEVAHTTIVRKDNWCDDIAINYLSQNVQDTTGLKNSKSGYDSLVEVASAVSKNFNVNQQQELVIQSLEKAFPSPITSLLKTLLPNTKFAREYYVVFTTLFFTWLIGPCEVKESVFNGRKEKNVVHIKKCRFLEESNCVGMCVNLCKIPSQTFIKNSLGMPLDMVPNFDDMSCEMIFGQEPPAPAHDPALKQPCYTISPSINGRQIKTKSHYENELLQLRQTDTNDGNTHRCYDNMN